MPSPGPYRAQEALGLLDGPVAAQEPNKHHHGTHGNKDVDACRGERGHPQRPTVPEPPAPQKPSSLCWACTTLPGAPEGPPGVGAYPAGRRSDTQVSGLERSLQGEAAWQGRVGTSVGLSSLL